MVRREFKSLISISITLLICAFLYNPLIGLLLLASLFILYVYWFHKYYRIRVETLQELISLSPSQFERAMATLLEDLGYRHVRVTGGSGDLARDIACEGPNGESIMIQCKKYRDKNVSSPEIQKFIGMMITEYKAEKGIFITTSDFTEPARKLAKKT